MLRNEALMNAPKTAPKLYVTLRANDTSQTVEASQLTTSWSGLYDQINGFGYHADSSGPLSIPIEHMEKITFMMNDENCLIELKFTDDYLPENIRAQRWDVKCAENIQDYVDVYTNGEPIPVDGLTLQISDDGCDYIYEVHAMWLPGSSYYAFVINDYCYPLY